MTTKQTHLMIFAGTVIFCLAILPAAANAQRDFDVGAYLKRKDANNNGKIEPDEMSSGMRSYVTKLGFDVKKPLSISKIVSKSKKESSDKSRAASRANTKAKVPGFGVDGGEKAGVRNFSFNSSAAKDGNVKNAAATKISDSVRKQVESTLSNYDADKDGSLDKREQSRARWGSPSPEASDLNKDGRLSRTELERRYQGRESYKTSSTSSRSRTSSRGNSEADAKSSREREREKWRNSAPSSSRSSRTSSTSSKSPSTSSKSNSSQVDRNKYLKYAKSLIESYDKDKDGKLSKDEVKGMRRPPSGADADKDGFISETELVDNLSGVKSTAKTSSSSTAKKSSYRSRSGGSSSSRSSRGSVSFEKLDSNGDKQVHMHEYSKEWNDEIVAEFYQKDKNGDGIITSQEWSSK